MRTNRVSYCRTDLARLKRMGRADVLGVLGSFEDRGLDDDAFVLKAAELLDATRVRGLAEAMAADDPDAVGAAVLAACSKSAMAPAPAVEQHVLQSANEILGNTFTFYGETHTLPEEIDWDANPGTAHWGHDLNRFTFLGPLAQAHGATGETKYARKAIDLMLGWIENCEIERCFAGTQYMFGSYLNNSIHCTAWAHCLTELLPAGIVLPVELMRILKSMHEQISYLEIVTNGHAGNWPTIGCQGCLATMAALPVFRDQQRFTSYYIETLGSQVEEQILPDGVQDELTPHYHAVVVRNILTCAASCAALGLTLEARTIETLKKMLRYQAQTITPDGSAHVAFNDSDAAHVPEIPSAIGLEDYSLDPDALGPEAFPYAGVAFLRQPPSEGDLYLAFDGGPFGRGHQHEDKLGFWLFANGRNLIVDPGRHLYDQTEVSYLPYLRTTHAHSTITVDGQGQHSRGRPDTWIATAPGSLTFTESDGEIRASAAYDLGYGADNDIAVTHSREIVFVDNRFWVLFDHLHAEDNGEHVIESRFQFAPEDIVTEGDSCTTQFSDANLLLRTTGAWDDVRILKGEQNPRAGWYSASYNQIEPAPMLSLTRTCSLPHTYAVLLLPYTGTVVPGASISFDGSIATVVLADEQYSTTCSLAGAGTAAVDRVEGHRE